MEGFQLYLSDRESANVFHRNNFNVDGADMHVYVVDRGHYYYNVKIFKEIYLEKQNCKNYRNIGNYNKVDNIFMSLIASCLIVCLVPKRNLPAPDPLNAKLHPSMDKRQSKPLVQRFFQSIQKIFW